MRNKICVFIWFLCILQFVSAQPRPIKQFLNLSTMRGASFSIVAKEVQSGEVLYSYDADRELTPASVLKLASSAAALELLGEDFRFETVLEYDGRIANGVLEGNLYIKGSGDPTLGSSHFAEDRSRYTPDKNIFMPQWLHAIKQAGITKITGSVIADESIFDTEGLSTKLLYEDMGSYYGAGSYGLSVFDNLYRLYLNTGAPGTRPEVDETVPAMPSLVFHNYMKAASVRTDSTLILGAPFSNDRYLYGVIPANRSRYLIRGDIPEPPLYLAQYTDRCLRAAGIIVVGEPSCYRLLSENGNWPRGGRKTLATTYSPTLAEIVRIINERSHNLYADAITKTLGLRYQPKPGEHISSFARGTEVVKAHWAAKGLDVSSLWMSDGSGLAVANKVSAAFICDLLCYMHTRSKQSDVFISSLPKVGLEGSVANFLKGTVLQGKALLKSGGMSRVRSYAGYITKGDKQYAVALFLNNYAGENRLAVRNLERLLLALFREE